MGTPRIGCLFFTALLTAAGCSGGTPQGSEGGACFPNGTCNSAFKMAGQHTVTLSAKDGIGNTYTARVTFTLV